eukprot:4896535-Prymnesium_polylepis.1
MSMCCCTLHVCGVAASARVAFARGGGMARDRRDGSGWLEMALNVNVTLRDICNYVVIPSVIDYLVACMLFHGTMPAAWTPPAAADLEAG